MSASRAVKVALWCRWFHRWRFRGPVRRAVNTDPASGQSLVMTSGPGRDFCWACEDEPRAVRGRAYRNWLAS